MVVRPRLTRRLNAGIALGCKLTLVSAPAGFGKSTLVSCWLQSQKMTEANDATARSIEVAWLSLDDSDNDPARFITYLLAALKNIGAPVQDSPALFTPLPPAEAVATALINDLTAMPERFALVLDDYHLIYTPYVHQVIEFLLEHQPPHMHLMLISREDPPLPLPGCGPEARW
jgi:LuxR family maltose regulon positive regulatory protein